MLIHCGRSSTTLGVMALAYFFYPVVCMIMAIASMAALIWIKRSVGAVETSFDLVQLAGLTFTGTYFLLLIFANLLLKGAPEVALPLAPPEQSSVPQLLQSLPGAS